MSEHEEPVLDVNAKTHEVHSETAYWMTWLAAKTDGESFLAVIEGMQHIFEALRIERKALVAAQEGRVAQDQRKWDEASRCYGEAVSKLQYSVANWRGAMNDIASDTPFDPYAVTEAERKNHGWEEPVPVSDQRMHEAAPDLFHIYGSMERVFLLGQELVQQQRSCLTNSLQDAEAKRSAHVQV